MLARDIVAYTFVGRGWYSIASIRVGNVTNRSRTMHAQRVA